MLKDGVSGKLHDNILYSIAHILGIHRPELKISSWNIGYRLMGADDRLPIPPTKLIFLVTISKEVSWFLHTGRICADSILYVLQKNGLRLEDFSSVLDFGCGCGRVLRHWKSVKGPQFYGTDCNPELIRWCQEKLVGLADFKTNNLTPPLDYPDEKFDLIYAISVFTHLPEDLQSTWMHELSRVLKKGGRLLITLHGESRLFQLTPEEQQRFKAGQMVVRCTEVAGTNYCGAYHPESYVRNQLSGEFDVLDLVPQGARDANQDVYLFRKPS